MHALLKGVQFTITNMNVSLVVVVVVVHFYLF